jgi:uncharacterized protein (TIGR00369 family)
LIIDLLRPEIVRTEKGFVEMRFEVRQEFTNRSGAVQGGIVAAMLDMAMAFADERRLSTASMHFEILRPVQGPMLTVTGRITKWGRRVVFAEAEMRDDAGELLARGSQTAVPLAE